VHQGNCRPNNLILLTLVREPIHTKT